MRTRRFVIVFIALTLLVVLTGCSQKQEEVPTAESVYSGAIGLLQEGKYAEAASEFAGLGHYYDASRYAMYCNALASAEKGDYALAASSMKVLEGFLDSSVLYTYYTGRAYEEAELYEKALTQYSLILQYGDAGTRAGEMPGKAQERDYKAACALEQEGNYHTAISAFEALDGYADSENHISSIRGILADQEKAKAYEDAAALEKAEKLKEAAEAFRALGDYSDSKARVSAIENKIAEQDYQKALELEQGDDPVSAYTLYVALGNYQDAADRAAAIREEASYRSAFAMADEGKYSQARKIYTDLGNYKDSAEKARLLGVCEIATSVRYLNSGVIAFSMQDVWGYIDLNNNYDVAPAYDSIAPFSEKTDLAVVSSVSDSTVYYGLINRQGVLVAANGYLGIREGENGYYTAVKKGKGYAYTFVLISPEGTALSEWLTLANSVNSDTTSKRNQYTLRTPAFTNGVMIALDSNNEYSLLNSKGEAVISGAKGIELIRRKLANDTALVNWGKSGYQLFSLDGKALDDHLWYSVSEFRNGFAAVCSKNNLWGYISQEDCHVVIEPQYHDAAAFSGGYAGVKVSDAWGYIDPQNNMVIDPQYRYVTGFNNGKAVVFDKSLGWKVIDTTGKLLYFKQNVYISADRLDKSGNYEQAIAAFESLDGYADSSDRALQAREKVNAEIYASAVQLEREGKYIEAAEVFEWLGNYSDAPARAEAARETQNALTYAEAEELEKKGKREEAIAIYLTLGDYRGSAQHAADLRESINQDICRQADELEAGEKYEAAIKVLNQIPDYTGVAEHIASLEEKIRLRDYNAAAALEEAGKYEEAIEAFTAMGGYSDSAERIIAIQGKIKERDYQKAKDLHAAGDFDGAIKILKSLNYKDSEVLIRQINADKLFAAGDLASAWEIYSLLDKDYQTHAADYASAYSTAVQLRLDGRFDDAVAVFTSLGNYEDSADQIPETLYQKARNSYEAGDYDGAADILEKLNYKDSAMLIRQISADKLYDAGDFAGAWEIYCVLNEPYRTHDADYAAKYSDAEKLRDGGDYDNAVLVFASLGSYKDSAKQILQTKYEQGISLSSSGKYDQAIALFDELTAAEYLDSDKLSTKALADRMYDAGDIAGAYDIYTSLEEKYQTHQADYAEMYKAAEALRVSGDYDSAYNQFIALGNYSDAQVKANQCGQAKADSLFEAQNYGEAAEVYTFIGDTEKATLSTYQYAGQLAGNKDYRNAALQYLSIADYEDSREQHYQMGLKAFKDNNLADAYEILAEDIDYSDSKENIYQIGITASEAQNYEVSIKAFAIVGAYKDSAMNLTLDTYAYGEQLYDAGRYDEAAAVFTGMDGFSNTAEKAQISAYAAAARELENGNYEDAVKRFTALGKYSDSETQVKNANYRWAESFFASGDYETAKTMFAALGNYLDSEDRLKATKYAIAQKHYDAGEYETAVSGFHEISGYSDANERELASRYALYGTYYNAGMYDDAIAGFESIAASNYSDSATQAKKSHYAKAQALDASDRTAAYDEYVLAADYSDAPQQVKTHAYEIALSLHESNNYTEAIKWYEIAADYSDAKEQLYKIGSFYFSTQDYQLSIYSFKTLAGYKDSSNYMQRIGNYYEMQSDPENAYLAYGYAMPAGEELPQTIELKAILESKAEGFVSAGKLDDAMNTYIILAKIDPAEKAKINSVYFVTFVKGSSVLKIGTTKWQYLAYENGKFVFIADSSLGSGVYKNSSYGTKKTAVDEWMKSAPQKYFSAEELPFVSLWNPSKEDIEKYHPTGSGRTKVWTSTKYSGGSRYYYYYLSEGTVGSYSYDYNTASNGIRPGMRLSYNNEVYQMIKNNPARYVFYTTAGKEKTFEPLVVEDSQRLPYSYEIPRPDSEYNVSSAGASYTFTLGSNGYFISGNKGQRSSCALCKITFRTNTGYIYLDCINYAEPTRDYGLISKLDKSLSNSASADNSSVVFKSFGSRSDNKSGIQTIRIPVNDTDEHVIYIKFIKNSYGNNYNDSLQFSVRFE